MEELDDDIIQMGVDAQQQALALVHKAISATTTHEKDKLIDEMRHIWRLQESCAQQLNHCNASMKDTLAHLQAKESNSNNLYHTLITNTSFLSHYERNPPSHDVKESMYETIRAIEEDIQKVGPLSSPNLLNQVSSLKNDFGLLKMRDLTFKRLEELAYTLKKRSFVVDDSEDLSLTVAEEYGNLNGLIQKHEELLKENMQLRSEEIAFFNDKIVKRRNLSTISSATLSNIAIELQNMLKAQERMGIEFPVQPELESAQACFDDACYTNSDIRFNKSEFSTTINPESVNALINATEPKDQLESLVEIVKQQEATISNLIAELEPLRQKQYTEIVEMSSQREERMWQLQDKFQTQIKELQNNINNTIDTCFDIHKNILMNTNQHCFYGQNYGDWMHKYKALIADDTFLQHLEANNVQITNSLAQSSYSFGLNQMFKLIEDNQYFTEYFRAHLVKPPPPIVEPHSPIVKIAPPPLSLEQESPSPMLKLHRTMKKRSVSLAPRKKKIIPIDKDTSSETTEKSEEEKKLPLNPIENASKEQILDYLALAYDIQSSISDNPTTFHHNVSGKLHFSLSTLRSQFYEETRFFEADMRSTISMLQVAEDFILRKPKAEAEVLADTEPRTEIEVQTEEETNAKGKGKGKPPPKRRGKK
ncbi:hypothetical protein TRFO_35770 [Tritrichomonas foetus]|uniref:Uncharacterized protein n=1 Tax=Tritrichomonas foetus TaxID=1144522 RepID=A0A1J4JFK8_9EUKA|nr:hypothetical protein TRFO_35770 [Tritrichomonas foetus]|eukprot:OHS97930.1 hypothetical protein TRFO_35770 [Tritrichomonas foetus]